ncbi:LPXTG cell wall anchor domain-containing protein [Serinibacter salmoneus]|uniref:LPXTG-motif cell wall-anchored protein n=1 Tax=Serinibacter salmoneus TaxID=556530 RepID=A0A2A9CWG7_9MICO|nr:LPXTG cell wall anchor domain-containing protein [Serinibacter salmoneus]PFG18486.1 LPXTG-motif cell wall-anchored protein [Serinibacter salmoneus]
MRRPRPLMASLTLLALLTAGPASIAASQPVEDGQVAVDVAIVPTPTPLPTDPPTDPPAEHPPTPTGSASPTPAPTPPGQLPGTGVSDAVVALAVAGGLLGTGAVLMRRRRLERE